MSLGVYKFINLHLAFFICKSASDDFHRNLLILPVIGKMFTDVPAHIIRCLDILAEYNRIHAA